MGVSGMFAAPDPEHLDRVTIEILGPLFLTLRAGPGEKIGADLRQALLLLTGVAEPPADRLKIRYKGSLFPPSASVAAGAGAAAVSGADRLTFSEPSKTMSANAEIKSPAKTWAISFHAEL